MKRSTILLTFLLFSLTIFSASTYNIVKAQNLKISETDIQKNNSEIEKRVKTVFDINSYSEEDIKNIVRKDYNLWSADSETVVNSFANTIKLVFSNVKYEIKEISYLTADSARITMTISVPDTSTVDSEAAHTKMLADTEKRFKEKTGLSIDEASKTKELEAKYAPVMSALYFEILGENIKNIKTYNKNEVSYIMKKNKSNWIFEDESLNFFVK